MTPRGVQRFSALKREGKSAASSTRHIAEASSTLKRTDGETAVVRAAQLLDLMDGYTSDAWVDEIGKLSDRPTHASGRAVRTEDLDQVVQIALEVTPDHPMRTQLPLIYRDWYLQNRNVFRFICGPTRGDRRDDSTSKIIGFTSVLPLTREGFQTYRSGKLTEWNLGHPLPGTDKSCIDGSDEPCRHILIQAIKLRPRYWQTNIHKPWPIRSLVATLVTHLAILNPVPKKAPPALLADAGERGKPILESYGFVKIHEAEHCVDLRPMYELDFEQRHNAPPLMTRLVGDHLALLMTISGAGLLAKRYIAATPDEVPLVFLLFDRRWLVNRLSNAGRPGWELHIVVSRLPTQLENSIGDLQRKLHARLPAVFHTVGEFRSKIADDEMFQQSLHEREILIVICYDQSLANEMAEVANARAGAGWR